LSFEKEQASVVANYMPNKFVHSTVKRVFGLSNRRISVVYSRARLFVMQHRLCGSAHPAGLASLASPRNVSRVRAISTQYLVTTVLQRRHPSDHNFKFVTDNNCFASIAFSSTSNTPFSYFSSRSLHLLHVSYASARTKAHTTAAAHPPPPLPSRIAFLWQRIQIGELFERA
jgi:hypothetical protein